MIVIAANRPLTLKEMGVILAIKDDTRLYKDLDMEKEDRIKLRIRNTCGLFLRVSDAKIYLIHQTAKEFLVAENLRVDQGTVLEWGNSFIPQNCDYILAKACLRYLSFATFESGSFVNYVMDRCRRSTTREYIHALPARYHFLEYSATQWGAHVRRLQLGNEDEVVLLSLSLCDPQSQRCELWSTIYYKHENFKFGSLADYTSLHIACLVGIEQVVRLLLNRGTDTNIKSSIVENALEIASGAGHVVVVRLLLKEGVKVNANALELASEYGHEQIVQLLLEHEADVDAQHGREGSALVAS